MKCKPGHLIYASLAHLRSGPGIEHPYVCPLARTRRDHKFAVPCGQEVERILGHMKEHVLSLEAEIKPGDEALVALFIEPIATVLSCLGGDVQTGAIRRARSR